jgi:hypothetical protein
MSASKPVKPILVLPTGTDKQIVAAAKSAGYLPIVTNHPERIKVILPGGEFLGGDLLMAALEGLANSSRDHFFREFHRRMKSREPNPPTQPA